MCKWKTRDTIIVREVVLMQKHGRGWTCGRREANALRVSAGMGAGLGISIGAGAGDEPV